jgi:rhodanese-related sulfurtransferase
MSLSKKDILYAFYIVLFSSLIALIYNYCSSYELPLLYQKGVINSDKIKSIAAPEIIRYYSESNINIIIDTRPEEMFNEGHIPGALSYPISDFYDSIIRLNKRIGIAQNIVIYCSNVHCSDSHTLAKLLIEQGYINVRIYPDGFKERQQQKYPIHK